MNNKNYFIFAAAIALASCSVDEYMGENPEFTQTTKENIIGFGGGTGSMSRATQNTGTTEQMLDKHFKVYGCKSTATPGTYQTVFNNYWVWYEDAETSSNTNKWEYVGNINKQIYGNDATTPVGNLLQAQYIKYWDYSADHYHFVAGTPQIQVDFTTDNTTKDVTGATIKNLAGHINPNPTGGSGAEIKPNPVYLAVAKVNKSNFQSAVNLQFTRLQTKVRVGIYETIPGYKITSISFYKQNDTGTNLEAEPTYQNNVILTSTGKNFYGGKDVSATVTYKWNDTPNPSFTYSYSTAGAEACNWYGGMFNGVKATSSNHAKASELYGSDNDMDVNTGYFTVIPNNNANAIVIKCDYTLTSDDKSGETINVKGATAAIPAAYCKWEPNKMYTYIFKISQETNGTTGTLGKDDPGLFPITFDATAIEENNSENQGTVTIINAPSITTHQAGSVTNYGIEYKTNTPIEITVTDDNGNPKDNLTTTSGTEGYIAVYKYTNLITEAELTVNATTTGGTKFTNFSISGNKASFTPDTDAYYAIQYCYSVTGSKPVYKYKVIKVGNPTAS